MAYNNPYLNISPATADYIVANYEAWMNKWPAYTIPGFVGVP